MQPPTLTRDQVRQVDRRAIDEYGMSGLVLMENAGRGMAGVLCRQGIEGPVVICCGRGNNAGDGFVVARHLDIRGYDVRVLVWAEPDQLTGDAGENFGILQKSDVPVEVLGKQHDAEHVAARLRGAAWVVDALLGTGARGEPRPPLDAVIDTINAAGRPVAAADLPSGLDCDTGEPAKHTIRARLTCTFAAAKPGFFQPAAKDHVGGLHVVDIGVPRKLIEEMLAAVRS